MSDTCAKPSDQRTADLTALHRQLQEMKAMRTGSGRDSRQQPDQAHGPVLIIRGK